MEVMLYFHPKQRSCELICKSNTYLHNFVQKNYVEMFFNSLFEEF